MKVRGQVRVILIHTKQISLTFGSDLQHLKIIKDKLVQI